MRQYLKKIKMLWRDTAGNMVPLAVAATIGMLFIILGVSEYMRLVITAAGVKDAVESAVVSTVNDNYNEVYHSVREGYAAGYEPDGEGFAAAVDYGDIYGRLCVSCSVLRRTGKVMSDSIMMAGGEYRISGLSVDIPNTALASLGETYYADASIRLDVPVRFGGKTVSDLSISLKVRAAYKEKF